MNTKHTPGPWHVGMKPGPIIYGPNGEQVADLRGDLLSADETSGNAALIAAAPDLLEALQAVLRFDSSEGIPGEYKHDVTIAIKVRAAITKATQQ